MHRRLMTGIAAAMLAIVPAGGAFAQSTSPATASGDLDPHAAALAAAGGSQLGGSVSMLGVLGGAELDAFMTIMAPFQEAVGTTVEYEGTRDLAAVLQTRVDAGNPPDLVSTPSIGQISAYAQQGKAVDLSTFLDVEQLAQDYDPGLLDAASVDGKLFGIFDAVNLGGLVWYDPKTYQGPTAPATWDELATWADEAVTAGQTPWCIGLESGAASGWPAANLITDLVLRQAGAEAYGQWWQGQLPWTSPEVKAAFETYGSLIQMVNGGSDAVLATPFANAADGIWTDPPTCSVHPQAAFMGGIVVGSHPDLVPIEDIDSFPLPGADTTGTGVRTVSGEIVSMFNDTPQARALVTYLATPAAQALIAKTGLWLSANKQVPSDSYPSPFTAKAAEMLASAGEVHYYGNALMPQAMSDAFWAATLDYTKSPDTLDTILAGLDSVQGSSSK